MMRPVDEGLTTIDIDMAQQLQSQRRACKLILLDGPIGVSAIGHAPRLAQVRSHLIHRAPASLELTLCSPPREVAPSCVHLT